MPKPSVASARNTPESLIAGIATIAPTGTATSPARSSAASHGMPKSVVKCANDEAPIAANAYWQSETCRDVRTRSPSESTRITTTSAPENTASLVPTNDGIAHNEREQGEAGGDADSQRCVPGRGDASSVR